MLKNILFISDLKKLDKSQQKTINGGWVLSCPEDGGPCGLGFRCPGWDFCVE